MRRLALTIILSVALISACTPQDALTTTTTPTTTSSHSVTSTRAPGPTTTVSDEPVAADFTFALGNGGSFTLSEASKPVYLVFWAEWCPTCRRELAVVDRLAAEFSDRVEFVAVAGDSELEATRRQADRLFVSGLVKWGVDPDREIFDLYDIPYPPVTVLIADDGTVVDAWDGLRPETELRLAIESLIDSTR